MYRLLLPFILVGFACSGTTESGKYTLIEDATVYQELKLKGPVKDYKESVYYYKKPEQGPSEEEENLSVPIREFRGGYCANFDEAVPCCHKMTKMAMAGNV